MWIACWLVFSLGNKFKSVCAALYVVVMIVTTWVGWLINWSLGHLSSCCELLSIGCSPWYLHDIIPHGCFSIFAGMKCPCYFKDSWDTGSSQEKENQWRCSLDLLSVPKNLLPSPLTSEELQAFPGCIPTCWFVFFSKESREKQEEASGQNIQQPMKPGLRIAENQWKQHPFFLAFA